MIEQKLGGAYDGESGAGDHDEVYTFGRTVNTKSYFPFNQRQFTRLAILRSRLRSEAEVAGIELNNRIVRFVVPA